MGAYEVQSVVEPSADFDGDGDVAGRDFLAWQRGYGIAAPNAVKANGDADDDTDVDDDDLGVWQDQCGEEEELSAVGSQLSASQDSSAESQDSATRLWTLGSQLAHETASSDQSIFVDSYVEQVARALE